MSWDGTGLAGAPRAPRTAAGLARIQVAVQAFRFGESDR